MFSRSRRDFVLLLLLTFVFTPLLLAQEKPKVKNMPLPPGAITGPFFVGSETLPPLQKEKIMKSLFAGADADLEARLIEVILALGWEDNLREADQDLMKFERMNPQYRALFTGMSMLTLSEKLDRFHDIEKLSVSPKDSNYASYLSAEGVGKFIAAARPMGLAFILYNQAPDILRYLHNPANVPTMGLLLGLCTIAILKGVGTYAKAAPAVASRVVWGEQIAFKDRVPYSSLGNASAHIACRHVSKQKSYLLNDEPGNLPLRGTWGKDDGGDKLIGFASQEDSLALLARCGKFLRKTLGIAKLDPNDIVPMASSAQSQKLHALSNDYPIFYYSSFVDDEGNAIKLGHFFKKPS